MHSHPDFEIMPQMERTAQSTYRQTFFEHQFLVSVFLKTNISFENSAWILFVLYFLSSASENVNIS